MFDPFFPFGAPNYFGVLYDEDASTMHFILDSMELDSVFFQLIFI